MGSLGNLHFYLNALRSSFYQQWKAMSSPAELISPFISTIGTGATIAWLSGKSGNDAALAYVLVGVSLMSLWTSGLNRIGWSLSSEHAQGTLELMMTTRTPVMLIMLGKTLAITCVVGVSSATMFAVVYLFAQRLPPIENFLALVISTMLALAAVIATSFTFAPFSFLAGARGGFFNAFMPMGTVVNGFLYPIGILPLVFQVVAHVLPAAYAMEAVVLSVNEGLSGQIFLDWGLSIVLSLAFLCLASYLFGLAEARVKVTGDLGRF